MSILFRIICGVLGVATLTATALLILFLLTQEQQVEVLLAAYMGIGGLLVGAFLLFYAVSGRWRPSLERFRKSR